MLDRRVLLLSFLLLFFSCQSVFALSHEGQAAIEEMRARLALTVSQEERALSLKNDKSAYIPGEELIKSLANYRRMVHKEELCDIVIREDLSIRETDAVSIKYIPGQALERVLVSYRAQQQTDVNAGEFDVLVEYADGGSANEYVDSMVSVGADIYIDDDVEFEPAIQATREELDLDTGDSSHILGNRKTEKSENGRIIKNRSHSNFRSDVRGIFSKIYSGSSQDNRISSDDGAEAIYESPENISSSDKEMKQNKDSGEKVEYEFRMPKNYRIIVR